LNNIPLELQSNILIILLDITATYEFMNAILTLNSILINPNIVVQLLLTLITHRNIIDGIYYRLTLYQIHPKYFLNTLSLLRLIFE
jgi:hypothetical protein